MAMLSGGRPTNFTAVGDPSTIMLSMRMFSQRSKVTALVTSTGTRGSEFRDRLASRPRRARSTAVGGSNRFTVGSLQEEQFGAGGRSDIGCVRVTSVPQLSGHRYRDFTLTRPAGAYWYR